MNFIDNEDDDPFLDGMELCGLALVAIVLGGAIGAVAYLGYLTWAGF